MAVSSEPVRTHLHTQAVFEESLSRFQEAMDISRDRAVMLVQVDGVDRVCATNGHLPALAMLHDFHSRLIDLAQDANSVMQVSNRKFAVLLRRFRNRGHVRLAAQKVHRLVRISAGAGSALNANIGIAMVGEHDGSAQDMLRFAEIALLNATSDTASVRFYERSAAESLFDRWDIEERLRAALDAGDIDLAYQPKIEVATGAAPAVEALMRWNDPEIGFVSPDVFIDAAEKCGLINDLTHFAIQRACSMLSGWRKLGIEISAAVNITPSIIQDDEIVEVLNNACSIWGVEPGRVTLEVTENALMADRETSHDVLTQIRDLGACVSIDDFGTGYSSLAYLKEIPADELKIDRTFVMNMLDDPEDRKIVEHTIAIAKSFGLQVVAEGVENQASLDALGGMKCDYAQGFHICRPVFADDYVDWYRRWQETKAS